ncbi:MAG: hypothetical protein U5K55_17215 [Aliarcobacter sp.]|nr:hypothetical protein [Aliarcobacter sp.]
MFKSLKYDTISKIPKGFIIATCKNCKNEIEAKKRQCPYCGILNPTVSLKDVFVGMAIVIFVMSIVTYFVNN